jgi:Protein of unknown function (DUF1565)
VDLVPRGAALEGESMRRLVLLATPIAVFAGLAMGGSYAAAAGTGLYVSTSGADTNPCTQSQPCLTLQHAVDIAPIGGTVHVLPGTYHQTVNITHPVTLSGAGSGKTIIDGSNIDTEAMSPAYFGVVSVENNTGTGGPIKISGLTVENAFITQAEYDNVASPTDVIVYADSNTSDKVSITGVALRAVQNASQFAGVGFDTFNDGASVSFTKSSVTGTFQGALLEGGGLGGAVTVTNINFTHLAPCAGACASPSATFPAEGLFVLSDQPGTAVDTINHNNFQGYAGFGIAADAGYSGGNCAPPNGPCTGNVTLTANSNKFALGACASASDDCAAIYLDAKSGNELSAHIQANTGTVKSPDKSIFENPDSGLYNVTEINNRIRVTS